MDQEWDIWKSKSEIFIKGQILFSRNKFSIYSTVNRYRTKWFRKSQMGSQNFERFALPYYKGCKRYIFSKKYYCTLSDKTKFCRNHPLPISPNVSKCYKIILANKHFLAIQKGTCVTNFKKIGLKLRPLERRFIYCT